MAHLPSSVRSGFSTFGKQDAPSAEQLLRDLEQPHSRVAENLDPAKVDAIEKSTEFFKRIVCPSKALSRRRTLFAWTFGSCAVSAKSVGLNKSGATSTVFRDVSAHIDNILQDASVVEPTSNTVVRYLEKLEEIPNHRFRTEQLQHFNGSRIDWTLISMAADASFAAYKDYNHAENTLLSRIARDRKFMTLSVIDLDQTRALVVSIRGTVTKDDWMLNFNNKPKHAPRLLNGQLKWHEGFLTVAEAMEPHLTKQIKELLKHEGPIDSVLFSGHSAGGAVAQIFYAMSMSRLYDLAGVVTGFKQVHCITFGTPPVASVVLHEQQLGQCPKPGRFWSVINEGDPVPQAQEEFMKRLIEVYVLELSDLRTRYPEEVPVPAGHFRASGHTIVLKIEDPDDESEEDVEIRAYMTSSRTLETMLFGNAFEHSCELYKYRVMQLARSASVEHISEDDKSEEIVIEVGPFTE
ncbi:alpha/beta-hydrolase [Didymella exigua CBS 183.55]|uniref:Alpha/beta-hydrolase n=1 Tax=Didymella exigua CBS 183.55 TaxID=1150837 RepID=A0A6A5RKE5_9PLEO|nr:alpha/beta-hydrolase [Didymella exigua CBS 183.55]KAF1928891.1 alpha/beta-hydrolase [Didymella exigua CBS 183.55]